MLTPLKIKYVGTQGELEKSSSWSTKNWYRKVFKKKLESNVIELL